MPSISSGNLFFLVRYKNKTYRWQGYEMVMKMIRNKVHGKTGWLVESSLTIVCPPFWRKVRFGREAIPKQKGLWISQWVKTTAACSVFLRFGWRFHWWARFYAFIWFALAWLLPFSRWKQKMRVNSSHFFGRRFWNPKNKKYFTCHSRVLTRKLGRKNVSRINVWVTGLLSKIWTKCLYKDVFISRYYRKTSTFVLEYLGDNDIPSSTCFFRVILAFTPEFIALSTGHKGRAGTQENALTTKNQRFKNYYYYYY